MKILKLMPDYDCYATWQSVDNSIFENIDPQTLNLSDNLIQKISNWEEQYENTFNENDPTSSGFMNQNDELNFEKKGIIIWRELLSQLENSKTDVVYFSRMKNKLFTWDEYFS